MRTLALIACMMVLVASAGASPTGNRFIPPAKEGSGDGASDTREGGESYEDAFVIPGDLGGGWYSDSGATCDNRDDVTPNCGLSYAPDVVYQLTPDTDNWLQIDLCGSGYDTILEIQDGIGVPIGCNDDYCGLQSGLVGVPVVAGHTYYIIVDGYGSNCGSYVLTIFSMHCDIWCEPDMMLEGEPDCGTDYVDSYNGGCNSDPYVFQPVWGNPDGTLVICGNYGTYSFHGWSYRDTDWFEITGTGEVATATIIGAYDTQLIFIYGADCAYPQYDLLVAPMCEYGTLARMLDPGAIAWIWVGSAGFSGVPCGSHYVLELEGISPGCSPTANDTWGEIKSVFR